MISVQNVSKDFGPRRVLHHVSFEVLQGEVLGLLGPNGAGKTTLLRILTGFFPPTEGKVTVDKRRMGYLPERLALYPDMKVEEFLTFVAEIKRVPAKKRREEIQEKMGLCGVESVRGRLIGHLSKGFLQRVGLAQALVGNPDILILDEPTSGLDPKQIIEIRELILSLGKERTLILSTHILPEVSKVCERVLILNQGRIVAQGKTEELQERLMDRQEILVRVGEGSTSLEVMLRAISGVESLAKVGQENSTTTYLLQTLPHQELRAEISKRIIEAGFPLLEMSVKRLSLEDVFLKLVLSEEAVESL